MLGLFHEEGGKTHAAARVEHAGVEVSSSHQHDWQGATALEHVHCEGPCVSWNRGEAGVAWAVGLCG